MPKLGRLLSRKSYYDLRGTGLIGVFPVGNRSHRVPAMPIHAR
jgi:hypothetical protein